MIPTEFRRSQLIPVVYGTFGRVVMSSVATMLTSLIPTVFSPCSNMLNYSEMVWNTGAVGYLTHDVNFVSSSYGIQNVQNYWWLRSPNTFSDPDVFAYLVDPSGDFYYGSLYVYHSYGRKNRRIRARSTAAVRGAWSRMVASSTATISSTSTPTGALSRRTPSYLICNTHGMFHNMVIPMSLMLYMISVPTG